jgi:endonuclease/exonuclease/phosphatase family metal-dependent hydrolase
VSPAPHSPWPLWLLVALAAAVGACTTLNYLDPAGPSYETSFAEPSPSPPSLGASLRVLSFNIAYAVKIDLALALLRESPDLKDPDVLTLQEMDAPGTERLARELGMNSVYFPSAVHPKTDRDFGCSILSPWPLVEAGKVVLPVAAFGSGVQRSAVRATVLRGEQRIRVYTVHLPSPLGVTGGARRQQLKVLLADAADSTDPVVITGDFNSYDVGKQIVEAGYSWPTRDVGATARFSLFGIRIFGMSIDHIFTRGLEPASDGDAVGAVQDNRDASDHLPVWAVLATATPDQR